MRNQLIDRSALRRAEIDRLDSLSRTRALTDSESRRLERLIYSDTYATYRRRAGGRA
jgi:hypothetical protein